MEQEVNRIEFVKTQKQNTSYKQANIVFNSVLSELFMMTYF